MKKVYRFTADWCAPCRMYAPIFSEVTNTIPGLTVHVVDVEDNPTLAQKYNIRSIPATVVENNGVSKTLTGMLSREELKSFIDS